MSYEGWFQQLQEIIDRHPTGALACLWMPYGSASAWLPAYLHGYSPSEAWMAELSYWRDPQEEAL